MPSTDSKPEPAHSRRRREQPIDDGKGHAFAFHLRRKQTPAIGHGRIYRKNPTGEPGEIRKGFSVRTLR